MKLIRGIAAFGFVMVFAASQAATRSIIEQHKNAIKVSVSETYHSDSVTRSESHLGGSSSETSNSSDGHLTFSAEIPLNPGDSHKFDSTTVFTLSVGGFSFRSALADDPYYISGKNNARLAITLPTKTGVVQQVLATAQLRWEKDKLYIKVEARTPSVKSMAAEDFANHPEGNLDAITKAEIRLGCRSVIVDVPFQVKVKRKVASSGDIQSESVNIELKGEAKTDVDFVVVSNSL